jgi:NodT family efflux transporter outer membrane factor (OMF) lipoprotein
MKTRLLPAAAIAFMLAGCAMTPVSDQVEVDVPTGWSNRPNDALTDDREHLVQWWKGYGDPILDELIANAIAANHDLKIAVARVREAQAFVTIADSLLYPTIDATANVGRNKSFERLPKPTIANTASFGLTAAWEVDLFGGNRLDAVAAAAQAQSAAESRRAVQVGLLAQVAASYLELRGAQKQTTILQDNIAIQHERLRLLEARYKAGLATELDVTRQRALLKTTEAAMPLLAQATTTLIHRLSVLLGEPPARLSDKLRASAPLPEKVPQIPALLPADLLTQRPDLRRAQAEVTAAAARLGSAKSDLFPKLFLSANVARTVFELGALPRVTGNIFALGLGLTAPIFNAGRIRAGINAEDARFAQAATLYDKTFLTALEEVENAFVAQTTARERKTELAQAALAADRAYRTADAFYQRGLTDFLSVLDAQRAKLSAEDEQTKAETAVTVSMVSLYRAFGGGWDSDEQRGATTQGYRAQ